MDINYSPKYLNYVPTCLSCSTGLEISCKSTMFSLAVLIKFIFSWQVTMPKHPLSWIVFINSWHEWCPRLLPGTHGWIMAMQGAVMTTILLWNHRGILYLVTLAQPEFDYARVCYICGSRGWKDYRDNIPKWLSMMRYKNDIQREKQMLYSNTYMGDLEKRCWWTYLWGRNGKADVENKLVDTAGEGEGEMSWEGSIDIYTPPCINQIASGKLLYNTGGPVWCSVMT